MSTETKPVGREKTVLSDGEHIVLVGVRVAQMMTHIRELEMRDPSREKFDVEKVVTSFPAYLHGIIRRKCNG